MDYLNNITLTIFIILLIRGRLTLSTLDLESMQELKMYISTLDGFFKNRPENMTIEEREQFEESYRPTISYTMQNKELTVNCDNPQRLESFLKEYIDNYNRGLLQEDSNYNEFDTINALDKMLISSIKDTTKNRARYIETAIKYAPLILLKYFENRDFIRDITIELASKNEELYPMMLIKPDNETDGVHGEYTDNWQDYFRCKYVLDMEWYSRKTPTKKNKRKKYSPQQQKMFDVIVKWLQKNPNNYFIETAEFKGVFNIYKPYEPIKKLNEQYRAINNISNKNIKLLKAKKNSYGYIILKNFQ